MSTQTIIRNEIRKYGYINIERLIEISLGGHSKSYYVSHKPIGVSQDFITSPEISQLFGEMIALWCIKMWEQMKSPRECNIIELGAGTGILLRTVLRTIKRISPVFFQAINLHIVDINKVLISEQKKVAAYFNKQCLWYEKFSDIKSTHNNIIIANEFFDVLPIKQYIKRKNSWYEICVKEDIDTAEFIFDSISVSHKLCQQLSSENPKAQDGAILEESPKRSVLIQNIVDYLKSYKGAFLLIDYGYFISSYYRSAREYVSTLQSIKNHQYNPVLNNIGSADLTSHVDFWQIEQTIKYRNIVPLVQTQKNFLLSFGIDLRLKNLIAQNMELSNILEKQYNRLVNENQMGTLFKVLDFIIS